MQKLLLSKLLMKCYQQDFPGKEQYRSIIGEVFHCLCTVYTLSRSLCLHAIIRMGILYRKILLSRQINQWLTSETHTTLYVYGIAWYMYGLPIHVPGYTIHVMLSIHVSIWDIPYAYTPCMQMV